jgi:hypothetical protein
VEIFKGYLDTVVTIHTSYYAFTGVLTAYYLARRKKQPFIKYALCLPLSLGGALTFVSYRGMDQSLALQVKVNDVVKDLAIQGAPPVDILRQSLLILGILDVVICYCLFLLIFCPRLVFGEAGQAPTAAASANSSSGEQTERK